jgi:hypothetical protein
VREAFRAHDDHLSADQRHDLMQIAFHLSQAAGRPAPSTPPKPARRSRRGKLAVLGDVLYGSGFGTTMGVDSDGLKAPGAPLGKTGRDEAGGRVYGVRRRRERFDEEPGFLLALFDPIGATPAFRFNGTITALSAHLAALLP